MLQFHSLFPSNLSVSSLTPFFLNEVQSSPERGQGIPGLTPEGGFGMVLRNSEVETGNFGSKYAGQSGQDPRREGAA
jgi:hypothetical protein